MLHLINCKLPAYSTRKNASIIPIMSYTFVEDTKYKTSENEVTGTHCPYTSNIKPNNLIPFLVVSI